MNIKLLTEHHLEIVSLKEGRAGSSESTLVKMPHCWKSCVATHMCLFNLLRVDSCVCAELAIAGIK